MLNILNTFFLEKIYIKYLASWIFIVSYKIIILRSYKHATKLKYNKINILTYITALLFPNFSFKFIIHPCIHPFMGLFLFPFFMTYFYKFYFQSQTKWNIDISNLYHICSTPYITNYDSIYPYVALGASK